MSQDKERELLPCPFCGSKEVSVANEEPHDNSGGYFIFCGECGASTNLRFAHGDDPVPLLREQWNRRAALASQPQGTEPVAWMHPDGRVVAGATMQTARKDGGAMLSSLSGYTIPLYAGSPPPAAGREPLTREQIDACWDGLTPSGHGKSRYDIARDIERANHIEEEEGK